MSQESLPNYAVDTTVIPDNVDPNFARIRNKHIEDWRRGEVEAESALRRLLRLYWATQTSVNPETRYYLADMASEFPIEAGMSTEEAGRIWREEMERADS